MRSLNKLLVFTVFLLASCLATNIRAQTAWHDHAENPVLQPGASGQWDDYMVANPFVLYDNGVYMMWYHGHPGPDTSSALGFANSTDGVNWTKYSGNPVMSVGSGWESGYIHSPSVMKEDSVYKMWYSGRQGLGGQTRIGFANSTDGVHWVKYEGNPVLDVGTSGSWEDKHVAECIVIKDGGIYKMWYQGTNSTNTAQIGYATSTDGLNWTKYAGNPVFTVGPPGSVDSVQIGRPAVVKETGIYRMWYTGSNGSQNTICYATASDEISWTRYASNPVLIKSGMHVGKSTVVNENGIYKMWYGQGLVSTPPSFHEICYAYSGISISNPVRSPGGFVQANENITISVNASAIQGVDTVLISCTTNRTSGWQNITMNLVSAPTYQAVIPAQPADTLVTYKIMANDTFGDFVVKDGSAAWSSIVIIPEFPSLAILSLVMIATLPVIISHRRKRSLFVASFN
jgi:predicted GH43/DUF377 family glycosyl hydrolase